MRTFAKILRAITWPLYIVSFIVGYFWETIKNGFDVARENYY